MKRSVWLDLLAWFFFGVISTLLAIVSAELMTALLRLLEEVDEE